MTHKFSNYSQFKDLVKATLTYGEKTATLEVVPVDPFCLFAQATNATWAIKLTTGNGKTFHKYFREDGTPVDEHCSILQSRMIDTALLKLPSVQNQTTDLQRAVYDYFAGNGRPESVTELIAFARHFNNLPHLEDTL